MRFLKLFLDGKSLPASCNPTSSQSKQKASPITGPVTPKVLNGRHLAMSGKRRKDTIDTMVQDEPKDVYRPLPGSKCITVAYLKDDFQV